MKVFFFIYFITPKAMLPQALILPIALIDFLYGSLNLLPFPDWLKYFYIVRLFWNGLSWKRNRLLRRISQIWRYKTKFVFVFIIRTTGCPISLPDLIISRWKIYIPISNTNGYGTLSTYNICVFISIIFHYNLKSTSNHFLNSWTIGEPV